MKTQQNIQSEGSKSYGRASRWGMFCLPLNEFAAGPMRLPLTMLLIAVGMVLLIACANIAGLQIARASARQRELAVRVALGASKARLLRQALIESVVLTTVGVVLGFAGGHGDRSAAFALAAQHVERANQPVVSRARAAVRRRDRGRLLAALRSGSRMASHAGPDGSTPCRRAAAPETHERRQPARALLAGGCADRALAASAGRRGPDAQQPAGVAACRARLRSRDLLSGSVSLPPTVYDKEEKQAAFYIALAGAAAQHSGSKQRRARPTRCPSATTAASPAS